MFMLKMKPRMGGYFMQRPFTQQLNKVLLVSFITV